jgi:putative transcriptional regulator
VRRLRKKRDWKLVDLSVETGLGRVFLSNLENGKHEPKLSTIKKLADAFGLTASQLLKGL